MNASETEKVARTVANATELHRSYILVLQREIYLTHPFVAYFVDTRVMCTSLILDVFRFTGTLSPKRETTRTRSVGV